MIHFAGRTAVITGAGSGFGREFARQCARLDMKLVLADIQADALDETVRELQGQGAEVLSQVLDVSDATAVQALADAAVARFGGVHLLFNNAGVGTGGYLWENTLEDWQWVLGVNLWGVIHGIRSFMPILMAQDTDTHVVNTASAAGLVNAQGMGVYNVSKHAVVSLSETLYQDVLHAKARVGVSVLCPAFVPTNIAGSHRNRPAALRSSRAPTPDMREAQARMAQAVESGRMTAAEVAAETFDAIRANRFYVVTHKRILAGVEQRMRDILNGQSPIETSLRPPG